MKMFPALLLLAAAPALASGADQRRSDQVNAYQARRDGRLMSLKEIEGRVVPTMRGAQYIGVDFDVGSSVYTLKFLRNAVVIWVEVDGRSGQVIGRTGR
ncbi:MAG TPA: hypothetical protein VM900_14840 [Sphingomonas sp.]|jgi:hypothetical protein|nr:hypothetical protein [Sphingomonas sp.]